MSLHYTGDDHRAPLAPLSDRALDGPGWDDMMVGATQGTGAASLAQVGYRSGPFQFVAFAPNDTLSINVQFSHRWNRGQVRPHIHWIPLQVPAVARNVRLTGKWTWAHPGTAVPADSAWTPFTTDIPVLPGQEYVPRIDNLFTPTTPADASESDFLLFYVTRTATGDTYNDGAAGNVGLLGIDVHYQAEKSGTYGELPGTY